MTFMDDFDGLDENSNERIRPEMKNLIARGNVTVDELEDIRCNSWEWEALVPVLSDEAFVVQIQRALDNCFTTRKRPFITYNAAVEGLYAPELLKRFHGASRAARDYAETIDNVRDALGQKATHYLIIADDVKDLVEAVESSANDGGEAARRTLGKLRENGTNRFIAGAVNIFHERAPTGFINNCALANHDEEKNCQICFGQCPDRERFEVP